MMLLAGTLVAALAQAQETQAGTEGELLRLRVVVPFDPADVELLEKSWRAHEREFGASATCERDLVPGRDQLRPGTLLLGYERGLLEELDSEGALASPPLTFALESWAPVCSLAGEADAPELESFEQLLQPELRGRVRLRRVTFESDEGLILGELASRLGWTSEAKLVRLVVASDEAGTLLDATTSHDALLAALPGGTATIAPVRAAVRARRLDVPLSFPLPREGFLALELAAAPARGASPEFRRWLDERFAAAVAPTLRRELELEPDDSSGGDLPEWMELVEGSRHVVDRAAAGALRMQIARLYEVSPPRSALPESVGWIDFVETLLLTVVVAAALLFAWRERRRR